MRRRLRIFFVLALALSIFASGTCAQALERVSKVSPALTGKVGRLIVQRTPNFGTHLSIRMSIDGKKVANIGRNQHYGGVLSAGRHVGTVLALPNTEARRPKSVAPPVRPGPVANAVVRIGGDREVNRLGCGAMCLRGEGVWGWPPDRANAVKVLKRAVELGVNLIDTADAYGPETDELLIAEALHPYPKGLVIATKGGNTRPGPGQWVPNCHPDYLKQALDKSLKRLQLERIDLYQLHRVDPKMPMEESLGALKEMQSAGKIRHVGLSDTATGENARRRKVLPIVSIQ